MFNSRIAEFESRFSQNNWNFLSFFVERITYLIFGSLETHWKLYIDHFCKTKSLTPFTILIAYSIAE